MLPIPASWDDITPAWMSAALGADVARVTVAGRDDGTNRRARLALTYASGSGPEVVFAKAEGDHREVHARNGNLFNEAELFASGSRCRSITRTASGSSSTGRRSTT
jgi:hypothetical protein